MKALVTGASGFIGSHLVERLAQSGVELRIFNRSGEPSTPRDGPRVERRTGDLRDADAVNRAVAGCDVVYHVAIHRQPPARDILRVNVLGAEHIGRACLAYGVRRLVFCSSCGVYGVPAGVPADEETPRRPNSPYRESKRRAEDLLLERFRSEGLPVVIARLSSVGGPRSRSALKLWRAIAAGGFRMINPGRNRLHPVDVADVVDGLVACAETPGIEGETFNLAGPEAPRIRDYLEELARRLGAPLALRPSPALPFRLYHGLDSLCYRHLRIQLPRAHGCEMFVVDRAFSIDRARARIGFHPRHSFTDTLDGTLAWYVREGLLKPRAGAG